MAKPSPPSEATAAPLGRGGRVASGRASAATSRRLREAEGRQPTGIGRRSARRQIQIRRGGWASAGVRGARTSGGVETEQWEGCGPVAVSTAGEIAAAAVGARGGAAWGNFAGGSWRSRMHWFCVCSSSRHATNFWAAQKSF